jgi:hypothetical protein
MKSTVFDEANPPPWYRQFWPWLLIALPATAVIASIATLIIAIEEPDGLVVGDYYKQGLAINQTLARDRNARFLGLQASGQIEPDSRRVVLDLTGKQPLGNPRLKLSLLHPTRAHMDQVIWLQQAGQQTAEHYTGRVQQLAPGNWYVLLEPEQGNWRLLGRLHVPGNGQLELQPGRG